MWPQSSILNRAISELSVLEFNRSVLLLIASRCLFQISWPCLSLRLENREMFDPSRRFTTSETYQHVMAAQKPCPCQTGQWAILAPELASARLATNSSGNRTQQSLDQSLWSLSWSTKILESSDRCFLKKAILSMTQWYPNDKNWWTTPDMLTATDGEPRHARTVIRSWHEAAELHGLLSDNATDDQSGTGMTPCRFSNMPWVNIRTPSI